MKCRNVLAFRHPQHYWHCEFSKNNLKDTHFHSNPSKYKCLLISSIRFHTLCIRPSFFTQVITNELLIWQRSAFITEYVYYDSLRSHMLPPRTTHTNRCLRSNQWGLVVCLKFWYPKVKSEWDTASSSWKWKPVKAGLFSFKYYKKRLII